MDRLSGYDRVLETERLVLREMNEADLPELAEILQDEEVMAFYPHPFSEQEVADWLAKQINHYRSYGFGLWLIEDKESGQVLGQCGLTMQFYEDEEYLEIGYLLKRRFWHQGYASEAAVACKQYAFETLKQDFVYSIIREGNTASERVALRNGMLPLKRIIRHDYGLAMPHTVYGVDNPESVLQSPFDLVSNA